MKKSHRKDVIIARITFAIFCFFVILLIVGAVMFIRTRRSEQADTQTSVEDQTDGTGLDTPQTAMPENTEPNGGGEPVPESNRIMRTTTEVNLRSEPNTNCQIITVLTAGTQLELIGEEDGWAIVDYQGSTGYVKVDYLEEVTGNTVE